MANKNSDSFFVKPVLIGSGMLLKPDGTTEKYQLETGLCSSYINACSEWRSFVNKMIIDFVEKHREVEDWEEALQGKIMLEDLHWDWYYKAFSYHSDSHNWFFMKTQEGIQGICLTYHPKYSIVDNNEIFYVEYLASAPWNRKSSLHEKLFLGVGKEMLIQVQRYFKAVIGLPFGFCLHSLPQAKNFYEKLGMIHNPIFDKDKLAYYEIGSREVEILLEANNV